MQAPTKVLLLCFAFSLASCTDIESTTANGNFTTPINFPVFFRSRFNPRTLQQNERLISVLDDTDVQQGVLSSFSETVTQQSTHQGDDQPTTESAPKADPEPECGYLPPGVDGFPWIAVLEHGSGGQSSPRKRTLSKGVLIDRQHVLTTVSSVHNSHPSWVVTSVRLGDIPTRRQSPARIGNVTQRANGTQRYDIETVFLHESKDIALIRLADGGVRQLTDTVRPICVPREDFRLESFQISSHVCQRSQIVSGAAPGRQRISRSRLQPLELVSGDSCNQLLRPHGARLPVKSFCARESDSDNCTGSLGGPAIANIRGRYHVLGLRSYLQTETAVDGLDIPSIYVRVGGLRKWISAVKKAIGD
uniref:Peptidase S1 domain-containing protein n=1 Tax=Anopheles epiroticus TaxID=199890 RepID=A0A182P2A2_9DIPT